MTPKELAQVRLATLRLDGDPNVDAFRQFIQLCDALTTFGSLRLEFTINNTRRINRITTYDRDENPSVVSDINAFTPWKIMLTVLDVLKHAEIRANARYRITPDRYAFERVATLLAAPTYNDRIGVKESVPEMTTHVPVTIL